MPDCKCIQEGYRKQQIKLEWSYSLTCNDILMKHMHETMQILNNISIIISFFVNQDSNNLYTHYPKYIQSFLQIRPRDTNVTLTISNHHRNKTRLLTFVFLGASNFSLYLLNLFEDPHASPFQKSRRTWIN